MHGTMLLLLYLLVKWMPFSSSTGAGKYDAEYLTDLSVAVDTERRFQNSGIEI